MKSKVQITKTKLIDRPHHLITELQQPLYFKDSEDRICSTFSTKGWAEFEESARSLFSCGNRNLIKVVFEPKAEMFWWQFYFKEGQEFPHLRVHPTAEVTNSAVLVVSEDDHHWSGIQPFDMVGFVKAQAIYGDHYKINGTCFDNHLDKVLDASPMKLEFIETVYV